MLGLLLALTAHRATAYDSSGGKRIAEITSNLHLEDTQNPELDPPFFPWNDQTRKQIQGLVQAALEQMPLDVMETQHPLQLRLSNSRCSLDAPSSLSDEPEFQKAGFEERRQMYLLACDSDNASFWGSKGKIAMAGTYLRGSGTPQPDRLIAGTFLHEMTHAWQRMRVGHRRHSLDDFFKLGFLRNEKRWKAVLKAHGDFIYRQSHRMGKSEREETKRCLQHRESTAQSPEDCELQTSTLINNNDLKLVELENAAERNEDVLYEILSLPSRYGGSTGRPNPFFADERLRLDRHAMKGKNEYLAILCQLLWMDPDLAARFYSPEEIA